jgi:glycosyltransferase involved in cell wall biosynthesis
MPAFSILIPTYNRKEKLRVVLEQLRLQEGIENGEVIVGVDGSTDGTEEWLQSQLSMTNYQLSIFRIENSGRAVIRNRLVERAQGDLIIFIQDDIVVEKGWLQAHLRAHQQRTGAVVGHITWYPEVEITPYMKWLEKGGHLLDFSGLQDGQELDFWHFYMGNISIPRDLCKDLRFDEGVPGYGWEDILYGHQFVSRGQKVYYSASALAYHWDEYRESDLEGYMTKVGRSAVWAERKHPGLGITPPFWKKIIFSIVIGIGYLFWPLLPQEKKWYLQMKKWFLKACREEERLRPPITS